MISARAGRLTMTRFSYGTGIHLDRFDPEAGNILVLNTLRGALDHQVDGGSIATGAGDSFVVDCSRTDYWLQGDPDHMQLNLTIPHAVMEETAERWFGFVPDDGLWTRRVRFGGPGSAWLSLLDYTARTLVQAGGAPSDTALARHIEEMLCVELLRQWAGAAGFPLQEGARCAAPGYVRRGDHGSRGARCAVDRGSGAACWRLGAHAFGRLPQVPGRVAADLPGSPTVRRVSEGP